MQKQMQNMASKLGSISGVALANAFRAVGKLKAAQDETTTRLASDTTGRAGAGNPDLTTFLTAPFKAYQMVQVGANAGVYGTLALKVDQQQAGFGNSPYYANGTPLALDRAGSGNFGFNIVRPGTDPAGNAVSNDTLIIQKRYKIYYNGDDTDPANPYFTYGIEEPEEKPKGYTLVPGERLDGSFYPGNIEYPLITRTGSGNSANPQTTFPFRSGPGAGQPYGNSFPTDESGNRLYNNNPTGPNAWNGVLNSVLPNPATAPTIASVTPDTYQLPDTRIGFAIADITITGTHFQTLVDPTDVTKGYIQIGWVTVGPYQPGFYNGLGDGLGAHSYRNVVDENTVKINVPYNMKPGIYDITIVGIDGQLAIKQNAFTVLAA